MKFITLFLSVLWGGWIAFAESVVTFYGGAGQVGGSCAVVQNGEFRVLVDCGAFCGDEENSNVYNSDSSFGFDPKSISTVLLTHAHQDHSGRITQLLREGFKGEILMTPPTLAILKIIWRSQITYETDVRRNWVWTGRESRDSRVKKFHWHKNCKWADKITAHNRQAYTGTRDGLERRIKKYYDDEFFVSLCNTCLNLEVEDIVRHVRTVEFGEQVHLSPFTVSFRPVKHLPGAAAIYFDDGSSKFVFSGDLGTRCSHYVESIEVADPVDAVFMETTYGERLYGDKKEIEEEYRRFRETIGRVVNAGGIAWIPAFALDRSQRVLSEIAGGMNEGIIPKDVPVFYLSPSSRDITQEYLNHSSWFDNDNPAMMSNVFAKSQTNFNPEQHKGSAILITTSGMMDKGFSFDFIPDLVPRNDVTVCLVGYQSPTTCGGKLKRGDKVLKIRDNGKKRNVSVHCGVENFWCFSGHGDAKDNDAWLAKNTNAHIYLVHGDKDNLIERKSALEERFGAKVDIVRVRKPYVMEKLGIRN